MDSHVGVPRSLLPSWESDVGLLIGKLEVEVENSDEGIVLRKGLILVV